MSHVTITHSDVQIDRYTLGVLSTEDFNKMREAGDIIARLLMKADKINGYTGGTPERQQARQITGRIARDHKDRLFTAALDVALDAYILGLEDGQRAGQVARPADSEEV